MKIKTPESAFPSKRLYKDFFEIMKVLFLILESGKFSFRQDSDEVIITGHVSDGHGTLRKVKLTLTVAQPNIIETLQGTGRPIVYGRCSVDEIEAFGGSDLHPAGYKEVADTLILIKSTEPDFTRDDAYNFLNLEG
jgi:hypothetical protein